VKNKSIHAILLFITSVIISYNKYPVNSNMKFFVLKRKKQITIQVCGEKKKKILLALLSKCVEEAP